MEIEGKKSLELLSEYFELKKQAKEIKAKRRVIAQELGSCEVAEYGKCYQDYNTPVEDWCERCQLMKPLSESLQANAYQRTAIMNKLRSSLQQQKAAMMKGGGDEVTR